MCLEDISYYYLRQESQIWCVDTSWDHRVSHTGFLAIGKKGHLFQGETKQILTETGGKKSFVEQRT